LRSLLSAGVWQAISLLH